MLPPLMEITLATVAEWAAAHGARILTVVTLTAVAIQLLRRAVRPAMMRLALREATPATEFDLRKRADTLSTVLVWTAEIALLLVAVFMALDELGFNVAPFLTGLGIGGIALGLGAQSLVRDTINGIFILVENQYGRGDLVAAAGVQGWVEDVTLRRTVLRDADGTLYSIPNSEVKVSANHTRGYSGISLLVPLSATSDLERAMEVIGRVSDDLATDPAFAPLVLEMPHVARVEALTDKGVTLRILGRAVPGKQFEVASALRRRIKRAFDEAEIRLGPVDPPPPPPPTPGVPPPAPPPAPMVRPTV